MKEKTFGPILFIPGINNARYPYCNSLYIREHRLLIDPASDRERLIRLREEEGVDLVWLTHFHEDHIMHLDLFDDLPVFIAEEDSEKIGDIDSFIDSGWYGLDEEARNSWISMLRDFFHYRPRTPAGFLKANNVVSKNGISIEIIHTPGHSPGKMCFYFKEAGILFTGDYDLTGFGPYYGDRNSSIKETIESIEKLRRIKARLVLTSHEDGVFENPSDNVWDKYSSVIWKREKSLFELLKTPKTMDDIVSAYIVYKKPREPRFLYDMAERALMRKHLDLLMEKGLVEYDSRRYVRCAEC